MNRTIFIDDKLKQITFKDQRFYTLDELVFYPGSTTILEIYPKGFGFNQWLKDVGNNAEQIADRAAASGSKIHKASEMLNDGQELAWDDTYSIEEWNMLCKFASFWGQIKPILVANEISLCSPTLGYGGTIDRVVQINGKNWILDIKTSNYIHTTHELQIASYAKLWNEFNPDCQIEKTGILWLKAATRTEKIDFSKDIMQGHGWQIKTFDRSYEDAFKVFQHAQAIFKEENPRYQPANLSYPLTLKL